MRSKRNPIRTFFLFSLSALLLLVGGYALGQRFPLTIQTTLFAQTSLEDDIELTHRILIIASHGSDVTGWYDSGAIAYDGEYEATLNNELAKSLQNSLSNYGVDSDILTENVYRNMMYYDEPYDFSGYDFVIELHFNASDRGTYTGTEVIYNSYNASDLSVHQAVADELETLSGSSMIYEDDEFLVQRTIAQQNIPSMLLETIYIDNYSDYTLYLNNKAAFVDAITQGLLTIYR